MRTYDVVIVGGGVVGCAIARRLSLTHADASPLLEAASDVGEGASKGNSGIATCGAETHARHARVAADPGLGATAGSRSAPRSTRRSSGSARSASRSPPTTRRGCRRCSPRRARTASPPRSSPAPRRARLEPLVDARRPRRAARAGRRHHRPDPAHVGYAELAARNDASILRVHPGDRLRARGRPADAGGHDPRPVGARFVVNAAGVEADTVAGAGRRRGARELAAARARPGCSTASSGGSFAKIVGGIPTR